MQAHLHASLHMTLLFVCRHADVFSQSHSIRITHSFLTDEDWLVTTVHVNHTDPVSICL